MADRKGKKRTYISISASSSSSSKEDDDDETSQEEFESESEEEYDDDADQSSPSTSCDSDDDDDDDDASEWSDDKGDESDDREHEDSSDPDDDESLCNRVIRLLQERSDLQELNLKQCKAYLRKHGLRITGSKAECIQRIKEHWRIKDGNGEALYPRSSFTINCTGDICKGDVVLFTQKVYEKFDKVTRRGSLLGKRTIAGRIVKESYGAAKQQHTFTVEVLWSKGIKKLPPLFPLLVKGRNLYKLKTFRQHWKNEAERSKVLAEKHKRGAAARLVRAMKKTWSANGGVKRQKHCHHGRLSQTRQTTDRKKGKCVDGRGKASKGHEKSNNHRQKAPSVGQLNLKQATKLEAPKSSRRHQNLTNSNIRRDPMFQSYAYPPQNNHQSHLEFHHHQSAPFRFPCYEVGSTSTMRFPHFRPYVDSSVLPASQHRGSINGTYPCHGYSHPIYEFEPRNLSRFPDLMNIHRPLQPFPFGKGTHGQRNNRC